MSLLILIIITLILSLSPVSLAADDYHGTIHGKALDRYGNILANVQVSLLDSQHKVVGNDVTNAKGEFAFDNVPMDQNQEVFMLRAKLDTDSRSYSSDTAYFNVLTMMVTEQNVDLVDYPPTGVGGLYGVVTIDQYLIIEEPATIYLDNGMFLIYPGNKYDQWCFDNLPQGKYVMWAERVVDNVTYASQRYNVTVPTDEKAYLPIYLPIKNPVAYHKQPTPMTNVVHGTVIQKNGALLPGAKVELYLCVGGSTQLKGTTWTDLNGRYRFDNVDVNTPTAKYLVRVTYEAGGSQRTQDSDQFTVYYTNTLNVNHDYDVKVTIQEVTTGSAMIRSVPAGASISIDGMDTGHVTPSSISLKTGAHMLGLALDGYFCDNSTLQVQPDASMNITRTLRLSTGNLSLQVNPENAHVFIDGKLAGTSPVTLTKKPAGEYSYVLVCDGYWNESGTVNVLPGESVTKEVNMVATGISLNTILYWISSFFESIGHIF